MTLALTAIAVLIGLWALSTARIPPIAEAPALLLSLGAAGAFLYRALGAPTPPTEFLAGAAEAGLGALVFVSAAQIRVSRFARVCPASFRLTLGGAPLFLVICSLGAFVLLPQLSMPSAMLLGGALMLNGAAFDRRAVTRAPAPASIKAAVRIESAAIIALGAPVAILIAGAATTPAPGDTPLRPLLDQSIAVAAAFAIGGAAGLGAARYGRRRGREILAVMTAAGGAYIVCALIGAAPVIAAGAAGLVWGEESRARLVARLRLRRFVERGVAPLAYFAFGAALGPRLFEADLLSILFAAAAVTVMRAGPRLAMLHTSRLPKESQAFLAWFGGAPGAASALFILSLMDNATLVDHEAFLTVAALSVIAGVFAARATSRPLANAFLRQTAIAKRRRMYAG
ncbi:MAG: cation:proton antiporter [Amphiplicatus sp.]